MDKLESVILANDGFNDETIMKFIASLLADIKVPTTRIYDGHIRFRPIGASTYGGYIYKSGVVMIFNEHYAPFSKSKLSLADVLKELCRKSKYAYMPIYKQVCTRRALYLLSINKSYDEVYGFNDVGNSDVVDSDVRAVSRIIPEDALSCYVDSRIPFKNSMFDKKVRGETTLWDLAALMRGTSAKSRDLESKTKYARSQGTSGKLSMPVVYPNFHLVEVDGKFIRMPNHLVMLDFDLRKQGFSTIKCRRIRAIIENMEESILVCDSFTKGNFWAIVAASEPMVNYKTLASAVMSNIESRLGASNVVLDRTSARITQMRFVIFDKNTVIKHPTMRFVEVDN